MGDTSWVPTRLFTLDNAPKHSNAALRAPAVAEPQSHVTGSGDMAGRQVTAEVESEQNSNTSLRRSGRQVLRSIKYTALLGWDFTC